MRWTTGRRRLALGGLTLVIAAQLVGATAARAQSDPSEADRRMENRARDLLRTEGKNSALDFMQEARDNLRKDGHVLYDYFAMEASGILAHDDSDAKNPGVFDGRLQPSQMGPGHSDLVSDALLDIDHAYEDFTGLLDDSGETMSRYADAAVAPYARAEIDTLVAHSWGCEVVYNAIFLGKMKAPKKILLAGVTVTNWAKWEALARYTGAKVIVYDNKFDRLAQEKRGWHMADNMVYRYQVDFDAAQLDFKWEKACSIIKKCNEHGREGSFQRKTYFGYPSHDRDVYEKKMIADGDLPASYEQAAEAQNRLVSEEANRLWRNAVREARDRLSDHDEKVREVSRGLPPAPTAAPLPPPAAPVTESAAQQAERRRFMAALLLDMQNVVAAACGSSTELREDQVSRFRRAEQELLIANSDSGKARFPDYEPESATRGLVGCARELMFTLTSDRTDLSSAESANSLARPVLRKYYRPPSIRPPHGDDDKEPIHDATHCHAGPPPHCDEGYTW